MQIKPCVVGPWQSRTLSDLYLTATNCPFATGGPLSPLVKHHPTTEMVKPALLTGVSRCLYDHAYSPNSESFRFRGSIDPWSKEWCDCIEQGSRPLDRYSP